MTLCFMNIYLKKLISLDMYQSTMIYELYILCFYSFITVWKKCQQFATHIFFALWNAERYHYLCNVNIFHISKTESEKIVAKISSILCPNSTKKNWGMNLGPRGHWFMKKKTRGLNSHATVPLHNLSYFTISGDYLLQCIKSPRLFVFTLSK